MASCENYLWTVVQSIEPSKAQKEGAVRSHTNLREVLLLGRFARRIQKSYLSGSYARDTAIAPLDDVDIIFVIDPNGWANEALGSLFFPTRPPPGVVLDSFASAIRYRYPTSSVYGQRRSVRLSLYHLDIDVVPAIDIGNDYIEIPDRNAVNWIKSSPLRHSQVASNINLARAGKFKPLVKLLKYWNSNIPSTASLRSFAIETMAVRLFKDVNFASLEQGLLMFFDFLSQFQGMFGAAKAYRWTSTYGINIGAMFPEVQDAAGTGSNLLANVEGDRLQKFIQNAVWSRDAMMDAQASRSPEVAAGHAVRALKA